MRVLLVHNRYQLPGGEDIVFSSEAQVLNRRGHDVEVYHEDNRRIAEMSRVAVGVRSVWSRRSRRAIARCLKTTRPDVAHFHNTFPLISPSAYSACREMGVPVVQTLHNYRPLCPAATFLRDGRVCEDCLGRVPVPAVVHGCYRSSRVATLPIAVKDALHSAIGTWSSSVDAYITPSEFARSRYVKAGWPAERIVVKYNTAPDPGAPTPSYDGGFLCLSRLAPEKGVDVLLDAWEKAFPGGGERLRIVGAGELEADLRRRAGSLAGVEFTGQL